MLATETFPGDGGSLLLDLPTLTAEMTGEGAELTLLRPSPCRTTLSTQVLNAGLYVYGCLSKRSMEIRSSNRYGLTWEKEKGEETRSLEIRTVVMASGHPWHGKQGGGMRADVVLLQHIFVALLHMCFN
jgi:hypothetical protein